MQQVTTGLLVWQIIIFPWAINQERQMEMEMLYPTLWGGALSAYWGWLSLCTNCTSSAEHHVKEAYSCNIQVTETLDIQKHSKAMPVEDWIVTQMEDPTIREIKYVTNKKQAEGV